MDEYSFEDEAKQRARSSSEDNKSNRAYYEFTIKQWEFSDSNLVEIPSTNEIEKMVFFNANEYTLQIKYMENKANWCFNIPFNQNTLSFSRKLDEALEFFRQRGNGRKKPIPREHLW